MTPLYARQLLSFLLVTASACGRTGGVAEVPGPAAGGAGAIASADASVVEAGRIDASVVGTGQSQGGRAGGQGGGGQGAVPSDAGADTRASSDLAAAGAAVPIDCGEWACWPMPNGPRSTLPNAARYDVSNPDVVTDLVTGLQWQRMAPLEEFIPDEQDPTKRCTGLQLGGYSDWRLPRAIELISLFDFTSTAPAATMKVTPELADSGKTAFWSSTPGSFPRSFWRVDHGGGTVHAESGPQASKGRTRCVRTQIPLATTPQHYTARGTKPEHTVRDNWTGLVWQGNGTLEEHTFAGAQAYCKALALDGSGWRVPTAGELLTLFTRQGSLAVLDQSVFTASTPPQDRPVDYWTSNLDVNSPRNAWFVSLLGSPGHMRITGGNLVDQKFAVRCVR